MKSSAFLVLLATLLVTGARAGEPGKEEGQIDSEQLVKAVFPDETVASKEEVWFHNTVSLIRIGTEWSVVSPDRSVKTCVLRAEDDVATVRFVALSLDPDPNDPSHPMKARIVLAVVRESKGAYTLLHKADVPLDGDRVGQGSYCRASQVKTVTLHNRTMVLFEYRFFDSISEPRGVHTIANLIDFTDAYEPKLVWACEVGYAFGGASQPTKRREVRYSFRDIGGDGYDEIDVQVTTVENKTFVWDGEHFVESDIYPVDTFRERMERKAREQSEQN